MSCCIYRQNANFVVVIQRNEMKIEAWKVWGAISKKRRIDDLFNLDTLNDWLQTFLTSHAPDTARSYLSSLTLFIDHVIRNGFLKKGISGALRFKEEVKLLSKQLKKVKVRRTIVEKEEIGKIITIR